MNTSRTHSNINQSATRYRYTGSRIHPLGSGAVASYNVPKDHFQVYPEQAIRLLTSCREYKTLDEHARNYLCLQRRQQLSRPARSLLQRLRRYIISKIAARIDGDLPLFKRDVQDIRSRLELFVKVGLLTSQQQLHQNVREALSGYDPETEEIKPLQILGIPTRNRSSKLLECLESYLENFQRSNRRCRIHMVDDSDEPEGLPRHLEVLREKYNADLIWVDRHDRLAIARRLASLADITESVAEFALLGNPRCDNRTGAARNTLLLMASGEPSVQVDDDIICRLIPSPWMQEGVGLVSEKEYARYEFYSDPCKNAIGQPPEPADFLGLHEVMLGHHPAAMLRKQKELHLNQLKDSFIEKLRRPDARIAATFTGVYGDSGMFRHWQRLCLEADSFHALTGEEATYREYLRSRQLLRVPERITIGDNPLCMAGVAGLDGTCLLPPFMPVQRNQDGVFGLLLYMNFPGAMRGYAPWAVLHEPPKRPTLVELSHALSVGPLRTNDILSALLWTLAQWPFGRDSVQNLQVTGRYLLELSGRSPLHFQASIRKACWQVMRRQMKHLQRCLDERTDAPEYWQRDVQIVLTKFQKLIKREDVAIPADLPGSPPERLVLFQQLTEQFGRLLLHWPALWQAAKEMRSRRKSLFGNNTSDKTRKSQKITRTKSPQLPNTLNGPRKTAILTTVWKRRELTRIHFENIAALDRPVFVGVSEQWAAKLCKEFGFHHVLSENQPLGRKKNRTLQQALSHVGWTHLMELGSDDLVDRVAFYDYEKFDLDHYGLNSIYFAHPETRRAMLFTYHRNFPSVFGAGRVLSRKAVEMTGPLWPQDARKKLDILSTQNLNRAGFRAVEVEFDPFIVDIKIGLNLWRYDDYRGTPVNYDVLLERFGLKNSILKEKLLVTNQAD